MSTKFYRVSLLVCASFFGLHTCLFAQSKPDSLLLSQATSNATQRYNAAIDVTSALYKGDRYVRASSRIEGHAFYESDDWVAGEVVFEKQRYHGIIMLYDVVKDGLVLEHKNLAYSILLEKRRIDEFVINGHRFVYMYPDSTGILNEGFYDMMLESESMKFLVKRKKILKKENEGQVVRQFFEKANRYYIQKDGVYHKVGSKGSVLRLFEKDERKLLKKFIKRSWMRFTKYPEDSIQRTLMHYHEAILAKK